MPFAIFVKKELTYTLSSSSDRSGISLDEDIPDMIDVISMDVSVICKG